MRTAGRWVSRDSDPGLCFQGPCSSNGVHWGPTAVAWTCLFLSSGSPRSISHASSSEQFLSSVLLLSGSSAACRPSSKKTDTMETCCSSGKAAGSLWPTSPWQETEAELSEQICSAVSSLELRFRQLENKTENEMPGTFCGSRHLPFLLLPFAQRMSPSLWPVCCLWEAFLALPWGGTPTPHWDVRNRALSRPAGESFPPAAAMGAWRLGPSLHPRIMGMCGCIPG